MDHSEAIRVSRQLKCKRLTKAMLMQGNEALQEKAAQLTAALAECQERMRAAEAARCAAEEAIGQLRQQLNDAERDASDAKSRLAVAIADSEAERKAAASPATAEALMPAQAGVLRIWVCMSDAAYRIAFAGQDQNGKRWELLKHADGSRRTVTEGDNGNLTCDCIHHQQKGQNAPACRHRRAIRALKQLFDTCGPRPAPKAAAAKRPATPAQRLTQAIIDEDHFDQFAGCAV